MINDLPGYVSKKTLSVVLSHGLRPLQTVHVAWHQPVGVPFAGPPSGASGFPAGCRTKRSAGQVELPAAELGKHLPSSEERE